MGVLHIIDRILGGLLHRKDVYKRQGEDITLLNPGAETARQASALLVRNEISNDNSHTGHTEFYVSDNPESFTEIASMYLQSEVSANVQFVDVDSL